MSLDSMFWVALQGSLALGFIHGVNPCGHSWLVLAPFVYGESSGRRVAWLTLAFAGGTSLACLAIGLTLGSISMAIPAAFAAYVDIATFAVLLALGLILIIKPSLLHSHEHGHGHCGHGHHCQGGDGRAHGGAALWGLFSIGFINMIVPCPTLALMYSYAIDSGSVLKGTLVFAVYALGTALALGGVIYLIHRAAGFVRKLEQGWVEPLAMRLAGLMTMAFGGYSLYTAMT